MTDGFSVLDLKAVLKEIFGSGCEGLSCSRSTTKAKLESFTPEGVGNAPHTEISSKIKPKTKH